MVYALSGQGPQAGAVLRQLVETNQTPTAYAEAAQAMRLLGDPGSAERLLQVARNRWPNAPALRETAR